jgi:hypothetical protein
MEAREPAGKTTCSERAADGEDAHGHFTPPRSGGYGPNGGELEFGSVAPWGLERGPGAIMVMSQRIAVLQISGWNGLRVIYQTGASVPVTWM